jgi:hypothetical protein
VRQQANCLDIDNPPGQMCSMESVACRPSSVGPFAHCPLSARAKASRDTHFAVTNYAPLFATSLPFRLNPVRRWSSHIPVTVRTVVHVNLISYRSFGKPAGRSVVVRSFAGLSAKTLGGFVTIEMRLVIDGTKISSCEPRCTFA